MIVYEEMIAVIIGGAVGALLRFLLSTVINQALPKNYPWGIWVVNILGCFAMGIIAALFAHKHMNSAFLRAGIVIGVLGGFTTFSSFSLDTFTLYQNSMQLTAVFYVISTVVLSILATWLGFYIISSISS